MPKAMQSVPEHSPAVTGASAVIVAVIRADVPVWGEVFILIPGILLIRLKPSLVVEGLYGTQAHIRRAEATTCSECAKVVFFGFAIYEKESYVVGG